MAAPDRVYRYFTNLKSKNSAQNPDTFFIRVAKPLAAYVTANTTPAAQVEELKAKFKIDGILWIKNPDVPKASNAEDKTVEIIDPTDATATITIEDPDLGDPDRSGFIAYVYPSGPNAAFHDIRETISGGSYSATDYSLRSWSRASKFRYKDSDDSEAAIILNDAGLNRKGSCNINTSSIGPYIYAPSASSIPRFNDIQIIANFYSTPYNRLFNTKLFVATLDHTDTTGETPVYSYNTFNEIADFGSISKIGPSGNTSVPTLSVKYIGRENPDAVEQYPTCVISFPQSLIGYTINGNISGMQDQSRSIIISLPRYGFKVSTVNEEGIWESDITDPVDLGLFIWNTDDASTANGQERKANNSNTNRVSLSHSTPEIALSRYNQKQCAANNQMSFMGVNPEVDPAPSTNREDVMLIYTLTRDFTYVRDPAGSPSGISLNDLAFFYNELASVSYTYEPLLPGDYVKTIGSNPRSDYHWNQSSTMYFVLRCRLRDTEGHTTGLSSYPFIESVYCLEYKMYPTHVFSQITLEDDYAAISRYWKLEYDETSHEWYWPKSRYNQNVKTYLHYNTSIYNGQGIPLDVVSLEDNTFYYLNISTNNINEGEHYTATVTNHTIDTALLYPATGENPSALTPSIIDSSNIQKQQYLVDASPNSDFVSSGSTTWLPGVLRIKRAGNWWELSEVEITVTYKSYTTMANEATTTTASYILKTIGKDPNNVVSRVLIFNGYSNYGYDTGYSAGTTATPNNVLSAAQRLPHQTQIKDVVYYVSGNKLYTDNLASSIADQGYYLVNWNGQTNGATADNIYYVDNTGQFSTLNSGN